MPGTLFVVASPLGNLADISARAIETLRSVERVYAEDTRRSRILLDHIGSTRPVYSLHEHNEHERVHAVAQALEQSHHVALLTDAGTPAVSDPGAKLVQALVELGYSVSPIAGPSALTAALSVCGYDVQSVLFVGFLSRKGTDRAAMKQHMLQHTGAVVFFESPKRLADTLQELAEVQPERRICMCRELTKLHEEIRHTTLSELYTWAASHDVLGELTLVLGPYEITQKIIEQHERIQLIEACLAQGVSAKDTATVLALALNVSKREMYQWVQQVKEKHE